MRRSLSVSRLRDIWLSSDSLVEDEVSARHAPLVLAAALIPLAGYPLLFLPAHLVWLELIMHPTALLAFQASARSRWMAQGSAGRDTRMFSAADWLVVTAVGLLLTALVVSAYMRNLGDGGGIR